ncbi:hypothetical protein JTE90_023733 [Oedothorax gibbosus]|uniref:Uncharacterized protein n=1 Tax=Oedothorax gibbosus TaxID=931172 RepID=A0AAV6VA20_9ARAC|nr:hypothetical protein JTE90_023733 [Oedothorax gibbosus]
MDEKKTHQVRQPGHAIKKGGDALGFYCRLDLSRRDAGRSKEVYLLVEPGCLCFRAWLLNTTLKCWLILEVFKGSPNVIQSTFL